MLIPARTRRAHESAALAGGVDELGAGVWVGVVDDGVAMGGGVAVGVGLVDAVGADGGRVAAVVLQPARTQHTSATVTRFMSPRRSGPSIRFGRADGNAVQASLRTTKAGRGRARTVSANEWSRRWDSNPRPTVYESDGSLSEDIRRDPLERMEPPRSSAGVRCGSLESIPGGVIEGVTAFLTDTQIS